MFLYLLGVPLPWRGMKAASNTQKYQKIGVKKQETPIEVLCAGLPLEVVKYMEYVRNLGFEDDPDYEYLRGLWSQVRKDSGESGDGKFGWGVETTRVGGTAEQR